MAGQHGRGQRLQLLRSSSSMTEASEAAKGCKIKEVSSIAQGLKACKADEFSKCRKYKEEVVSIMAACSPPTLSAYSIRKLPSSTHQQGVYRGRQDKGGWGRENLYKKIQKFKLKNLESFYNYQPLINLQCRLCQHLKICLQTTLTFQMLMSFEDILCQMSHLTFLH